MNARHAAVDSNVSRNAATSFGEAQSNITPHGEFYLTRVCWNLGNRFLFEPTPVILLPLFWPLAIVCYALSIALGLLRLCFIVVSSFAAGMAGAPPPRF
jgi:hypothetical protein